MTCLLPVVIEDAQSFHGQSRMNLKTTLNLDDIVRNELNLYKISFLTDPVNIKERHPVRECDRK